MKSTTSSASPNEPGMPRNPSQGDGPAHNEGQFERSVIDGVLAKVRTIAGRSFVIAIDGPGGSGKSTLAREIEAAYGGSAAVVEGDDFYADLTEDYRISLDAEGGYQEYFDWQRLRDQVLLPASTGQVVRYQRYDWDHARMGVWRTVPSVDLLLVEGVYVSRPELREYSDLVVWVATSEQERLSRQMDRNENEGTWIGRWMAAEQYYADHIHQPSPSEILISGG
jgi:uridine kinase